MEAICSSETSVDSQRTTRRYISEDGTLHNHRCDNLRSYDFKYVSKQQTDWSMETKISKVSWYLYLTVGRKHFLISNKCYQFLNMELHSSL
jgi:hypothetical protein